MMKSMRKFLPPLLTDNYSTFTRLKESRPFDKFSGLHSDMIQYIPHRRAASCCINIPSRLFNCRSEACLLETLTLTPRPDLIPDRLLLVLLNFFQETIWTLMVHSGTCFGACLLTYSMQQSPPWEANQFSASQEIPWGYFWIQFMTYVPIGYITLSKRNLHCNSTTKTADPEARRDIYNLRNHWTDLTLFITVMCTKLCKAQYVFVRIGSINLVLYVRPKLLLWAG